MSALLSSPPFWDPSLAGVPISLPPHLLPGERFLGQRPPLWHFDFETFNALNIKQVGTDVYTSHPSLEILLTAQQLDPGPGQPLQPLRQTESEEEALEWVSEALQDPDILFAAFNAPFEDSVLRAKGIIIPWNRWICVMAWSYTCSFRGGLREVGEELGIPTDSQKLKSGTRLITKFCSPRKPTKNNPAIRIYPEEAPGDWQQFRVYNGQDVTAEIAIAHALEGHFPNAMQRAEYVWDREVNQRGLPIDMDLVRSCCTVYQQELDSLENQMKGLTGLKNPNSLPQLTGWLGDQGCPLPNLQKATVRDALDRALPQVVHDVLTLRAKFSRSSPKKWRALLRATGIGDRLRNAFQLWGASRTQRWAGRVYQPQNLPHPSTVLEFLAEIMKVEDRKLVEILHPTVIDALVSLIRNAVTAPEGKLLGVADLSSIESVVIGYISNCKRINKVFQDGRDLYKEFGSGFFNKAEEEITKQERQFSKAPILAAGYGISPRGLVEYAEGMGVPLDEKTAEFMLHIYHNRYPEVSHMWRWVEESLKFICGSHTGTMVEGYCVKIWRDDEFLYIQKPSGWCLKYHKPRMAQNKWGKKMFSYMGWNQFKNKWTRLHSRGAMVVENIVQGIARDILMHGMWLAYNAGLQIVGHVHDEAIIESDEDKAHEELKILERCLTTIPACLPGIWLGSEGHVMKRYAKK